MITFEQVKNALGETGMNMTNDQITNLMATFDYLSDKWLDMSEIAIFGKSINDIVDSH